MKPIQIGTILDKTDDTTDIYERFRDYFDVDDKEEWFVKYIISKEPSKELIKAITLYYAKVKEENKAHDEFVDWVAADVLEGLSQKEKDYIFLHPDDLSSEIMARIASLLISNYDYENLFYRYLYNSFSFNHLRRLYYAVKGEFPDALMDQYSSLPDDYAAAREVVSKVKAVVLDAERFKQQCTKYEITQIQYEECKNVIDAYNETHWDIVPYDIAILTSKNLNPDVREKELTLLKAVLKETPQMALELPTFMFNQKDAVLLAVSARGKALKRFSGFNSNDDVIRAALTDNGESIQYVKKELRDNLEYLHLALSNKYSNALKMRCMIKYRDDEAMVRIALEANGCNIKY